MPTLGMPAASLRRALLSLLSVVFFFGALSCNSGSTQPGEPSLTIVPDSFDLVVGESLILGAFRVEPGGSLSEVPEAEWQSLDESIASVDTAGRVRAISEGSARILAIAGDLIGVARIVVLDPVVSLRVEPESAAVAVADGVLLQARAVRASGQSSLATGVTWTSLDPTFATVDAAGRVIGVAPGTARIEGHLDTLTAQGVVVVAHWRLLASLPAPRRAGHLAALDGKLYYTGGVGTLGLDRQSTTFVFDPATGIWTRAADMPTPRDQGAAVTMQGRLHVIGGINDDGFLATHEAYTRSTDTWEALAPLGVRRHVRADTLGGLIYAVAGSTDFGAVQDTIEMYDVTANSWSPAPSLLAPRQLFAMGSIGGKLYVAGGEGPGRTAHADVFVFDPLAASWSEGPPIPTPRLRAASTVFEDKLVVAGGDSAVDFGETLTLVQALDPVTEAWSTLPPLPTPVKEARAAVVAGELYVVGGVTPQGVTDRVLKMIP